MAQSSNSIVQVAGNNSSGKRRKCIRAIFRSCIGGIFRRGKHHVDSVVASVAPPVDQKSPGFVVETNTSRESGPTTKMGTVSPNQSGFNNRVAPAIVGNSGAPSKNKDHEDDKSSPPPTLKRDLWAEAWNSAHLTDDARQRLQKPWNTLHNDSGEIGSLEGDENIELNKPPTEGEAKRESQGNSPDYVQQVVEETKRRLGKSQQNSTNQQIARNIIVSTLTFKQLIDAGLQFDPTGYGASAWAVISFGLTLVDNDQRHMDLAFEATAYLSELLTRYQKIELYYIQVPFESGRVDVKDLENAIVEVYIAILQYSAAVKEAADSTLAERIVTSIKVLIEEPLRSLKEKINRKDDLVGKWKDIVDRHCEARFRAYQLKSFENIHEEASKILTGIESIKDDTAATRSDVEYLVREDILNWLRPPAENLSIQKHQSLRRHIEDLGKANYQAGNWFIQKPEYHEWKKCPKSVLWLHAPYGFGKSWLCSTIVEDLSKFCSPRPPQPSQPLSGLLVYWYFQADDIDVINVLRSILGQLYRSSGREFPKEVHHWLSNAFQQSRPFNKKELIQNIKKSIAVLKIEIFIVLDGPGEISLPSHQGHRIDILKTISGLIKDTTGNLHMLIVSKPEEDIKNMLLGGLEPMATQVDVKDGLDSELNRFINVTLENDEDFKNLVQKSKEYIIKKLKEYKRRNFLWASSMFDDLRECGGKEDLIKEHLNKVPSSMATRYNQGLSSVEEQDRQVLRLILVWLLRHHSEEPLTGEEVANAANLPSASKVARLLVGEITKISMRTIKSARNGSGYGNGSGMSPCIEFVHISAKEHLEALLQKSNADVVGKTASWFAFSDEEAHCKIATRCLQILLEKDKDGQPKQSPLKGYASKHWHKHYLSISKALPATKEVLKLKQLIKDFFTPDNPAFDSWLDHDNPDDNFRPSDFDMDDEDTESERDSDDSASERGRMPRADPAYYAVKLHLFDIAKEMIQERVPHAQPGKEGTVLQLALYHEYWEVVNDLLDHNDDLKTFIARDGPHGTPLYIASAKGKVEEMETLLKKGARPDGSKDGKYGSALHAAAYFEHTDAVKLLLEKGQAGVNQEGGMFETALQAAAAKGSHDVVQVLLDHKADPSKTKGIFGTALQAALAYGAPFAARLVQNAIEYDGTETSNRSGIGWQSASDQLEQTNRILKEHYTSLFPPPAGKEFQISREPCLPSQALLTGVLEGWHLPNTGNLRQVRSLIATRYSYQAPIVEQLGEIIKALPNFRSEQELNRLDFCCKALFWSGINHILKHLDPLISRAITSMRDAFVLTGNFSDSDKNLLKREGVWSKQTLAAFSPIYRLSRPRYVDMDLSDKLVVEMARQQEMLRERIDRDDQEDTITKSLGKGKERLRSIPSLTRIKGIGSKSGRSDEEGNDDNEDGNVEIHLVVDSLLPLVRDLAQLGKQCDRLHNTTLTRRGTDSKSGGESGQAADTIKSLTFEVFTAVARLAISISEWDKAKTRPGAAQSLAQTVRLLTMVRLPRMTKLAAAANQQLLELKKEGDKPPLKDASTMTTLGKEDNKEKAATTPLNTLLGLVQEELAPALDQLRNQTREQIQDAVRDTIKREIE